MTNFTHHRRREGTISSDFPPVPHILLKKTLHKNNIVVGTDVPQVRFLEQRLKVTAKPVQRVTDDMLAGYSGLLYHVTLPHQVDLSPELRQRTGIWAADLITKGSSAINTLVKFAASRITHEHVLNRETIDRVANELLKTQFLDIRALICKAVSILLGSLPPKAVAWKEPWESPTEWLTLDMDPRLRLNVLYKNFVGYSFYTLFGPEAATEFGVSPAQQQYFKTLRLDPNRVHDSITVLGRWKEHNTEPYICACLIAAIWS
jgi:hypothetical protein